MCVHLRRGEAKKQRSGRRREAEKGSNREGQETVGGNDGK